ncbi:HPr family phosphocarrier protein [Parablautia intestinalis]|uniref:HPr family phosphocarrier protein n=1 Tax=Parablautia intestinalis TaxID=2320100 RepID=A0A3A9AWY3_9FIRM|nr:HPr family phosphocarrier protein [Parablautia intestinalis]MCI8615785.1 HPr family phosphocarrier protein [Lachnospiraceae bacterium]MDE7047868.1 HPr family phosphocarrier protein [Lachnospiraceae bacterium]RKI90865.1 HPr family phosphocarrier protein [Parablautia intestinalis]
MMEKFVKIQLSGGLEARPIAMLVQVASQYESSVYLETEGKKVNAKSIMGMMSLALDNGESVKVITNGEDEQEAMKGIEEYLSDEKKQEL